MPARKVQPLPSRANNPKPVPVNFVEEDQKIGSMAIQPNAPPSIHLRGNRGQGFERGTAPEAKPTWAVMMLN